MNINAFSNWIKKIITRQNQESSTQLVAINNSVNKKIINLNIRLDNVVKLIKKTYIKKRSIRIGLNCLPWYLMIGSPNAGKTSLLTHANLKFLIRDEWNEHNKQNEITLPSTQCNWWISPDAIIIDVPGHYTTKEHKKYPLYHKLWQHLLTRIVIKYGKKIMNGIIIVIAIDQLNDETQKKLLIDNITKQIKEIQNQFNKEIPFYIALSKCDLIPGFTSYFNDATQEELIQAWGITMPSNLSSASLTTIFNSRFNALIKRLNEQLIWRLHRERSLEEKHFIKNFPIQMEWVKENIIHIIDEIANQHATLCIKGMFLTSALQEEATQTWISNEETIIQQNQTTSSKVVTTKTIHQAYFIKDFIRYGIMQ